MRKVSRRRSTRSEATNEGGEEGGREGGGERRERVQTYQHRDTLLPPSLPSC